jgi:hypothetical protein
VRTREELADDADDGSAGPVCALDAQDLELLEVGEVVWVGEVGEAVVPLVAVGAGEERGAGVRREVGAQHEHGEVAAAAAAGARGARHGTGQLCCSLSESASRPWSRRLPPAASCGARRTGHCRRPGPQDYTQLDEAEALHAR